ncbi:MAG: hypothetical protein JNK53_08220, partial [Phycisphaerae bacterium]|nr:hypothetical protein [Phycisphaerae bacterium]
MVALAVALAGCASDELPMPSDARTVELGAFVTPPRERPEVVAVPGADVRPPTVRTESGSEKLETGETVTRTQ